MSDTEEIYERGCSDKALACEIQAIQDRTDISQTMKNIFINSMKKRYESDIEYHKPDKNGFSRADYDNMYKQRKELEKKAIKLGMDKKIAETSNNLMLNSYIDRMRLVGKPLKYDESEIGSPDFEKHDGTDYR